MIGSTSNNPGECPSCGLPYEGSPNQCDGCGMLINESAADVERPIQSKRKPLRTRKTFSDIVFLIGLLLGALMITSGENLQFGLFIVLAGGFASQLSRYSDLSGPGTTLIGSLGAVVAAVVLIDSAEVPDDSLAAEEARAAYASALNDQSQDVIVHTRGGEQNSIWFAAPADVTGECEAYPASRVREHLKDLGFRRVVVRGMIESEGLCSFRP